MMCGIIQTTEQFREGHCPNCEAVFPDVDPMEYTLPTFEGQAAVADPQGLWVARWLRVNNFVPGMYAVKVSGRLPHLVVEELEERGFSYRPRDGSALE